MPQFNVDTYYSQVFWLIITFGFLYLVIYKFVAPIAKQIMHNRQSVIETNVSNAAKLAAQAEKLQQDYTIELSKISNIVETIKKDAITTLNSSCSLKKMKLYHELKEQIQKNLDEIELDTKVLELNQDDVCVNLAMFIVEKITNQQVDLKLLKECYGKIK